MEFFIRFNFKIYYRPGKQGAKPNILIKKSGDLPKKKDLRLMEQYQILLEFCQI